MERVTVTTGTRRPVRTAAARERLQQAAIAARTIIEVMDGRLFGEAPPGLRSKQDKPDTAEGWDSVREFAEGGVPLKIFLHQRHYGGAFRQLLNATSGRRGDLIEDAVEALFTQPQIGLNFVRIAQSQPGDPRRDPR